MSLRASNGGMFLHFLLSKLPHTFRAAAAIYAEPLVGFNNVPPQLEGTSLLQIHGRQDTTIPPAGGLSAGGWRYVSEMQLLKSWAAVHGCSATASEVMRAQEITTTATIAASVCNNNTFMHSLNGFQCYGLEQTAESKKALNPGSCVKACCDANKKPNSSLTDGSDDDESGPACTAWQFAGAGTCWIGNINGGCDGTTDSWEGGSSIIVPPPPPTPPPPTPPPTPPPAGTALFHTPYSYPIDSSEADLACVQFTGCKTGRVALCEYQGEHGSWFNNGDDRSC